MSPERRRWTAVQAYLQAHIAAGSWYWTQPRGSGHETYVAHNGGQRYFVKLDAALERYVLLAADGLTPAVRSAGLLDDGTTILVQPLVAGHRPSRREFQAHGDQVAGIIRAVHRHPGLHSSLPPVEAITYRAAAARALADLRQRWLPYRPLVPAYAAEVEAGLATIEATIAHLEGAGLVAAHSDPCNDNWLITDAGRFYLLDLETMVRDDPARDLGALLWWYYPPTQRAHFLHRAGYADDPSFRARMRMRLALHCLQILLPRGSDPATFQPEAFGAALVDFRAVLAGNENPQGYS